MHRASLVLSLLGFAACGPKVASDPGGTTTMGADDGSPTTDAATSTRVTTADPADPTTVTSTAGTTVTTTETGSDVTSDDGGHGSFLRAPDLDENDDCDLWIDDCPRGTKCMPWASDNSWSATRCSPLAEDPNQIGEPCTVEGSGISGIDDCESQSMCWYLDPETNMGECVAFCTGSEAKPTCADPCTHCHITNDGFIILCLPNCDPLAPDCVEGQACYPSNEAFTCFPDASDDTGALGDACEYTNACDPGLFCAGADTLPSCASAGCCTPFCDASIADSCVGAGEGIECIPWFDDGQTPPCLPGTIGACVLPK